MNLLQGSCCRLVWDVWLEKVGEAKERKRMVENRDLKDVILLFSALNTRKERINS